MRWILPQTKFKGDDVLSELLVGRGIQKDQLADFLSPSRTQIRDPFLLHDTKSAAEIIGKAIEDKEKIYVYGDYDVDGVTATSILWDFLYRQCGAEALPFIPSRFDEGYGLSRQALDNLLEAGAQMVITVDCGIKDVGLVEEYSKKGLKFVITDHHSLVTKKEIDPKSDSNDPIIPKALAVVHPRHIDSPYPFPEICGAVVSWKLAEAINELSGGKYDTDKYLELAALGTVCDVMPLVDENRSIVALGLEQMRNTQNTGLKALLKVAGVDSRDLESYHLGFVIGPRLNASGRLDSAMDALRLLTTTSPVQARELATRLQELNLERQEITQKLMLDAEAEIADKGDRKLYFVYGHKWPEGVVGLVAGKLKEKYNRPVLVGSLHNDMIKGSARSIPAFHIAEALKEVSDLLEQHGGHAQAAGFTLSKHNLESFSANILRLAEDKISEDDMVPELSIDLELPLELADTKLVDKLYGLAPFGYGNTQPVFAFSKVRVSSKHIFGNGTKHVKLILEVPQGNLEAVAFQAPEEWCKICNGDIIDVAGNLTTHAWNGKKTLQVKVRDIKY